MYDEDRAVRHVDVLVEIAEGHGVSPAQVALAWLLGRPGVSTVIVGARTDEQLADNLGGRDARAERRGARAPGRGEPAAAHLPVLASGDHGDDRLGEADLSLLAPTWQIGEAWTSESKDGSRSSPAHRRASASGSRRRSRVRARRSRSAPAHVNASRRRPRAIGAMRSSTTPPTRPMRRSSSARVSEQLGPIDILVVNSGGPPASPDALSFTLKQWRAAYELLLLGAVALTEAALPGMRERGWGRVLSLSSSVVREPNPVLVLSAAHRAGLLAAMKTFAAQVAADGVTVNTLLPGVIATDRARELGADRPVRVAQIPAGRLGTVEEFAAAAAFLCSEPAAYITGTTLLVDGGAARAV